MRRIEARRFERAQGIEATIDGRKIKIHAGDEVRDIVRRYDKSTQRSESGLKAKWK